ncbi:hypothetical protein FPL06_11895 [Xanthomonas citri pv. glycines]|nr:hypothetical protein FPK90_14095 [Xanthomonas citri pv. glycines]QDS07667.1 hypothetical protein FPL00_13020 [Xanthomonas citri pv. glycines]QDS12005.1 hypothetical protein FPL03_13275 [Xanthomonas citri pv. glycines]QDS20614.1 hypothetical protein FPL05_13420 [Xanthomonas citri pv. glycines]TSJ95138.1 hypothetical protein FPK99_12140 [Xanthomonas citri pv. glycines]
MDKTRRAYLRKVCRGGGEKIASVARVVHTRCGSNSAKPVGKYDEALRRKARQLCGEILTISRDTLRRVVALLGGAPHCAAPTRHQCGLSSN